MELAFRFGLILLALLHAFVDTPKNELPIESHTALSNFMTLATHLQATGETAMR